MCQKSNQPSFSVGNGLKWFNYQADEYIVKLPSCLPSSYLLLHNVSSGTFPVQFLFLSVFSIVIQISNNKRLNLFKNYYIIVITLKSLDCSSDIDIPQS